MPFARVVPLVLVVFLAVVTPATAGWRQLTPEPLGDLATDAFEPSLAEVAGTPWIAWSQNDGVNGEIRVARLTPSGAWQQVGEGASPVNHSPTRHAAAPSIASVGGVPWVAWYEFDGVNTEIRVARLEGSDWVEVVGGDSPVNADPTRYASHPKLLEVSGRPFVVWSEGDGTNVEIRAAQYGADFGWTPYPMGPSPINHDPGRNASYPSLADVGGRACVSWTEEAAAATHARAACEPQGRVGPGTKWTKLGGTLNQSPTEHAGRTSIASLDGVPIVAWTEEDDEDSFVRVARFVAGDGTWQPIGGGTLKDDHEGPSLIAAGGRPWVAFHGPRDRLSNFDSPHMNIVRFDGAWTDPTAGDAPLTSQQTQRGTLATIRGIPWVVWEEDDPVEEIQHVRAARLEPEFLEQSATVATDGALLSTRLRSFGLPYAVGFAFGPAHAGRTATATTSGEEATVTARVTGIAAGTRVEWRPFAVAGSEPRVTGPAAAFTTHASPVVGAPGSPDLPSSPPPVPPARPAAGTSPLTLAVSNGVIRLTAGRRKTTRFVLNRPATVTFTLRRGNRSVMRITLRGRAGVNRIRWRAPRRAGRYTALLTARADTRIATASARVSVRRAPLRSRRM